jgi:putative peptidoglycan lipid II flippase
MILKNSAILVFFSIFSLLLGVVRDRLLATVVGVGPTLDVYNASFRIPDLLYGIFFAVVSAQTVVPFLTKHTHAEKYDLDVKFNSLFFFFAMMLVVIAVITFLLLPFLAPLVVPGFTELQRSSFIMCSGLLLLQPLFLGLSALISCLAQVKHRFILYSVAPLVYTTVIIASIWFVYPRYGIIGMVSGVVLGAVVSFLVQSYTLYESRMMLKWNMFSWDHVRSHMRVAVPRSLSTIVSRSRELVYVAVATTLGVGVLSVYLFAQRIMDAFVQVVSQSAATATLPLLAHTHMHGEHKDYVRILKTNIIIISILSVCATILLVVYREVIVHVLYGNTPRGGEIALMVKYLAFSLPVYATSVYLVSAFSASKDTMGLFYTNLLATMVGIAVLLICRHLGQGVLSFAYTAWAMNGTYLLLLVYFYSRKKAMSASL